MFYIIYLSMYKVHMHANAIRKLLCGCAYVWELIQQLKHVDCLPVYTHIPYSNLHLIIYKYPTLKSFGVHFFSMPVLSERPWF